MNRPSPFIYLVGNPLSCLALLFVAGALVFQWWTHQESASWIILLIAFFIASTAIKANEQLTSYRNWKREYDDIATGGQASIASAHKKAVLKNIIAAAIWVGLAYWLLLNFKYAGDVEYYGTLAYVFGVINLALVLRFIRWRMSKRKRIERQKEFVVAGCLPVPRESPTAFDALPRLPEYSRRLLQINRSGT